MTKSFFHLSCSLLTLCAISIAQQPPQAIPQKTMNKQLPVTPSIVEDRPGYNSWPMIGTIGKRLVCAYSKGTAHDIGEGVRGVYAKTSDDLGKNWSEEYLVSNQPAFGEVTIGKGNDDQGAFLLWVRCVGTPWHHDLYRSKDGHSFERIATPALNPMPMQITDIFPVPGVGRMSLWFAGNYKEENTHAWGTLVTTDGGLTWKQHTIQGNLSKADWPTELSAAYLGNGRILVVARTERTADGVARCQFQLQSEDSGTTWTCVRTNIGDVVESTPSLHYNPATGIISNYYYQRGRGFLKRRALPLAQIWNHPTAWPEPEIIAIGSADSCHAGNVNAVFLQNLHCLAYYTGNAKDTAVVVATTTAP